MQARAFEADPDATLAALPEPVLLDEWQAVPEVLGAVKRAVDRGAGAGRFLLTGSVRAKFTGATWPGTGRVVDVHMYGLTQREIAGRLTGEPFLSKLEQADIDAFAMPPDPPDLLGYIELALRGGFPNAVLDLSPDTRGVWLERLSDQLLTRDPETLHEDRDPHRLRLYFEALALNTAGLAQSKTLYDAAGIDHKTATAYERLLTNLLVLDILPAWSTNRLSRMTRTGKRYLVDTSLMAAALDLNERAVLRDGDLLGRMIDTLVLAQIRPEAALTSPAVSSVPPAHRRRTARDRPDRRASGAGVVASRSSPPRHPRAATPSTWSGCASNSASASSPARCCTRAHDRFHSPSGSSHCRSARSGVEQSRWADRARHLQSGHDGQGQAQADPAAVLGRGRYTLTLTRGGRRSRVTVAIA